ncbi:MAG TPA: sugar ABC transporter permease [Devosia sp.]|jgi:multiple sugar transport system permease protein|nr:sugar ABC transporter permease [Devosia sp.]
MTIEQTSAAPPARRRPLNFNSFLPYGLIAPAVLVALAIAVVPLIYAIWLSFQDWYLLRNPQPVWGGLKNYEDLLSDASLWRAFWRTCIWTLGTVAVEIALALPLALLLNRDSAIAKAASAIILLPWVMPFVVLGFGWRFLLDSEVGTVHQILQAVGIAGNSSILNDPTLSFAIIIFISGWKGMPFMVLALLAALKSVPEELYEAAEVDGAGPWQRFRDITFPSIRNTMLVISLVLGILAFYSFDLPWIMTKGGPGEATTILGISMFKAVFTDLRPAYAAAISVVMLLILVVGSMFSLRLRRKE